MPANLTWRSAISLTTPPVEAALKLGNALLGSIEARTKLLYGYREPTGDVVSRLSSTGSIACPPNKKRGRGP